ncbi:hypothetical protein N7528_003163 [Penicillium herquei]|nr:hypothetical protein N7528_003163 [Penicillium herquei]
MSVENVKKTPGSCLCGQVRYELTGSALLDAICHCPNCRKFSGSIFGAGGFYKHSQIAFLSGQDQLKIYKDQNTDSGNLLHRAFCSNCGSYISVTRVVNGVEAFGAIISAGTLDLPSGEEWVPKKEIYCKNRTSWLPTFEGVAQEEKM